MMYDGNLVPNLIATADRISHQPPNPQGVVRGVGMDRMDAILFLADAKMHLANKPMSGGDARAWFLLDAKQGELWRQP